MKVIWGPNEACRLVWVRSRSRRSLPVECDHPSVGAPQTFCTGLNGKDVSGRGQRDCICPNWPQLKHLTLE